MKPAPFHYVAPATLEEALALLSDDARPLAGGQSLVPMLNFRLARPETVVDLNGIEELSGIARDGGGTLRIGAMTRQAALERSDVVAGGWPLLTQAVRHVGHPQTRSRGTVGGSVAHADPAAELPAALMALDAVARVRSPRGERVVPVTELYLGPLMTVLEPDELLVALEVPALPAGARTAFREYARTHGDFAAAGVAVLRAPGAAAIALLGAGPVPCRAPAAERLLAAGEAEGAAAAAGGMVEDDEHRAALLTALVRRAIEEVGA